MKYDVSFLCQPQHFIELPAELWEVELAREEYTSEDGDHEVHTSVLTPSREAAMLLVASIKKLVQANIRKRKTLKVLQDYRDMCEYGYPKAQALSELHYIVQSQEA